MGKVLTKLREHREGKGLTQEELAQKASCTVRTIAYAEKMRGVHLATARGIARGLGVKLEELL